MRYFSEIIQIYIKRKVKGTESFIGFLLCNLSGDWALNDYFMKHHKFLSVPNIPNPKSLSGDMFLIREKGSGYIPLYQTILFNTYAL